MWTKGEGNSADVLCTSPPQKRCKARTRGLTAPCALPSARRGPRHEVVIVLSGLDDLGGGGLAAEVDAAAVGDAHAALLARVQAKQALQEL